MGLAISLVSTVKEKVCVSIYFLFTRTLQVYSMGYHYMQVSVRVRVLLVFTSAIILV